MSTTMTIPRVVGSVRLVPWLRVAYLMKEEEIGHTRYYVIAEGYLNHDKNPHLIKLRFAHLSRWLTITPTLTFAPPPPRFI